MKGVHNCLALVIRYNEENPGEAEEEDEPIEDEKRGER
jgi:hypothetical protein